MIYCDLEGISVDQSSGEVFWLQRSNNQSSVRYCLIDGSCMPITVNLNATYSNISSLLADEGKLYLAVQSDNSTDLVLTDKETDKVELVRSKMAAVVSMAVLKAATIGAVNSCQSCQHLCLSFNQSKTCLCAIGYELSRDGRTCDPIRDVLLYSNGHQIRGLSYRNGGVGSGSKNVEDSRDAFVGLTDLGYSTTFAYNAGLSPSL